jgi:hypothetical protein
MVQLVGPAPAEVVASASQIHRLLAAELDRSEEAEWRMDGEIL